MTINGLLFDIDNVFLDSTRWLRWSVQQLRRLRVPVTFQSLRLDNAHLTLVYQGKIDHWEAIARRLQMVGLRAGEIDELLRVGRRLFPHPYTHCRAFPGVVRCLAQLAARRVPMGILGNSHMLGQDLGRFLPDIGIESRFEFILTSRDVQASLPSQAALGSSAGRLGVPVEQVGYVAAAGSDAGRSSAAGHGGSLLLSRLRDGSVITLAEIGQLPQCVFFAGGPGRAAA